MSASQSVVRYLTHQIGDLVRLGPVHAYTWVSTADGGKWMQVSVHDGAEHYFTILCVLPPNISKAKVDRALGRTSRKQVQANHGVCLVYYLANCRDSETLLAQAPIAAEMCAELAALLWNATTVEQFHLLGARGPRLPYVGNKSVGVGREPRTVGALSVSGSIMSADLPAHNGAEEPRGESPDAPQS